LRDAVIQEGLQALPVAGGRNRTHAFVRAWPIDPAAMVNPSKL